MNLKKSSWKIASLLVVFFFLLKPEFMILGVFIDGMGLELFVLLLEVQAVAVFGYFFQSWVKPAVKPLYQLIQKFDPYFFIPTKNVVAKYPIVFVHAIPGFIMFSIGLLFVKFNSVSA